MRHRIQTGLFALALYGGLLCAGVTLLKQPIEAALSESADRALAGLGAELTVTFEGRDGLVAGVVREPGQLAAVVALVGELPGVRVVESRVEMAPLEPASFAVESLGEGVWAVEGRVASEAIAVRLESALRVALGAGAEIEGGLMIADDIEPAVWVEAVEGWLGAYLDQVPVGAGFAVFGSELLLVGEIFSEARRDEILAAARGAFIDSGVVLSDGLQRVVPEERATFAIAPLAGGGHSLYGQLRDAELRRRLVNLVKNSGRGGSVEEQMEDGDHIVAASWGGALIEVIPGLVTEVEGLQIAVSEGEFLMVGEVRAEVTREALAEMVGQAFDGLEMKIDNQLAVVAPLRPPSLVIFRGEDGVVRLQGLLSEVAVGRPFVETVRSHCGAEEPPVATITYGLGVGVAPWVDKMVGLVPVFIGSVRWGALSVHADEVALEVEVVDAESGDVLRALVENAFPVGEYKRVIEIRLAAVEGPSDEDVMALESATADTVIYFDAASSDLEPAQRAKLQGLVTAFTAVPGASLALFGNTAEGVGEGLARVRCVMVRDALEEMGVEFLLMEIELREGVKNGSDGRVHESAHRVAFEVR